MDYIYLSDSLRGIPDGETKKEVAEKIDNNRQDHDLKIIEDAKVRMESPTLDDYDVPDESMRYMVHFKITNFEKNYSGFCSSYNLNPDIVRRVADGETVVVEVSSCAFDSIGHPFYFKK